MENTNIITDANKKFLYDLVAKLSLNDYRQANPNPKMRKNLTYNIKPYGTSYETNKALEAYKMALKPDCTAEEIEYVKAFILREKLKNN